MRHRRDDHRLGFTLLELLAAFVIFGLMASVVLVDLDRATSQALGAVRARELRVLAEERLGKIAIFEREFDDIFDRTEFDEFDEDRWEGWEWRLDIRDVVVFGDTTDERAEYLFGPPEEDDEEDDPGTTAPGSGTPSETQYLRELTLVVYSPEIDGVSDSVAIVTFLPLVDYSASGATTPGGEGGGGGDGGGN